MQTQIALDPMKIKWRCIPFLAGSVPDLSFDGLVLDNKSPSLELNTNSGFGIQTELIPGEASKYLWLTHSWVADEDHFKYVVYLLAGIAVATTTSHGSWYVDLEERERE